MMPKRAPTRSVEGLGVMVGGKYRVEVGSDFSAELLGKVLDVLERRR